MPDDRLDWSLLLIRVHHLNASRSQRVLWLLEELGIPYEIVFYRRASKTMRAPSALRKVHPLGKAPILEDNGRIFTESGVILDYLVTQYGPDLAPAPDDEQYWRYRYWMHYAEGSLMSPMLLKLVVNKLGPLGWPIRNMVNRELERHLDFLESEASKSQWFAGDQLSAADIMMSFPLEAAAARAGLDSSRPHLWRVLQQIRARPAYGRALVRSREAAKAA